MISRQATLAKRALEIIHKVSPPAPELKSLKKALKSDCGREHARAWDAKFNRNTNELNTWTLHDQLSSDRPFPYVMTFGSKKTQYGR